ncbi:MAG: hypothetical protein ACOH15_01865 [Acetobacterium sp.]
MPFSQWNLSQSPNRFIAKVMINQVEKIVHVPTTGRMSELLIPGVRAVLS